MIWGLDSGLLSFKVSAFQCDFPLDLCRIWGNGISCYRDCIFLICTVLNWGWDGVVNCIDSHILHRTSLRGHWKVRGWTRVHQNAKVLALFFILWNDRVVSNEVLSSVVDVKTCPQQSVYWSKSSWCLFQVSHNHSCKRQGINITSN